MSQEVRLNVNIDHVATLRQARRALYPDPIEAAKAALDAGASGITVHLREDRRHIQDDDVRRLRTELECHVNLEIAATEQMLRIAKDVRPQQVTLVPERPDEITTEGGLDLLTHHRRVQRAASDLHSEGISVSIFLDPDEEQVAAYGNLSDTSGFEINTDRYSRASEAERASELEAIRVCANQGVELGGEVYAGHGLTTSNVGPVAAVAAVSELNIGHWLVSRSVLVGMHTAVREMCDAMASA